MPQLDQMSFFSQVFWFMLFFYTLYFLIISIFLPLIFYILKFRVTKFSTLINQIELLTRKAIRYNIFHIVNFDNFSRAISKILKKEQIYYSDFNTKYNNIFESNRKSVALNQKEYYNFLKHNNYRKLLVKKS